MKRNIAFIIVMMIILILSTCTREKAEKASEHIDEVDKPSEIQDALGYTNQDKTEGKIEDKTQDENDILIDSDSDGENNLQKKYIIFIDPGHQAKGNYSQEPIGPGTSETKPKVSSGTRGVATGKYEYELVLEVSLKLKDKFESNGYTVLLSRDIHDVDISNAERAKMANDANADVFLRIHADGASSQEINGISILYPSLNTSFIPSDIIKESEDLAELVLDEMIISTGAKNRGLIARNDISGFNWSRVPVILIEMGFMTNPQEDKKMSTDEYQQKIVAGIYNGVIKFLEKP